MIIIHKLEKFRFFLGENLWILTTQNGSWDVYRCIMNIVVHRVSAQIHHQVKPLFTHDSPQNSHTFRTIPCRCEKLCSALRCRRSLWSPYGWSTLACPAPMDHRWITDGISTGSSLGKTSHLKTWEMWNVFGITIKVILIMGTSHYHTIRNLFLTYFRYFWWEHHTTSVIG